MFPESVRTPDTERQEKTVTGVRGHAAAGGSFSSPLRRLLAAGPRPHLEAVR